MSKFMVLTTRAFLSLLTLALSPCPLRSQNVIDDQGWGEKYDDTYGYADSDSDYWARSAMYPLGPRRYDAENPRMYLEKTQNGYNLVVRLAFNGKPWTRNISLGQSLRLATDDGDTVALSLDGLDKFVVRQSLGKTGSQVGGSGWRQGQYCVDCVYNIPDIDAFLGRTYVGFNVGGYYNQDYGGDAKRAKSLNRNLRAAKKGVDRRVQSVMKRRYLSTRSD